MTHHLNPCIQCKSPAVEQIRDEMGPGDYKEVQKINHKGHWRDDPDYYKDVHVDDYNKDDFRISCSQCDNATGWIQPHASINGIPALDVGKEYSRKLWNDRNKV